MNDLTMWSAIIGFVMPAAIAFVNQARWSKPLKGVVAFMLCMIAAAVTVWIRGEFVTGAWLHSAVVVFFAAVGTYHTWWKPSGIGPTVEAATSTR